MNKLIILWSAQIFLFAGLMSCEKEGEYTQADKAVVEAFLQPGLPTIVKVTKEMPFNGDSTLDYRVSNLSIKITSEGKEYLLKSDSAGYYSTSVMPVTAGKKYVLDFIYNGYPISATTTIPEKPENVTISSNSYNIPVFGNPGSGPPSFPDPILVKWTNTFNDYHYLVVKSVEPSPTEITMGFRGGRFYSSSPDQSNNINLSLDRFRYYGKNVILLYRVQSEYAQLYNTTGTNSQNLTKIPTNVNNGLGIFTGINVSDSLFVNVQ